MPKNTTSKKYSVAQMTLVQVWIDLISVMVPWQFP